MLFRATFTVGYTKEAFDVIANTSQHVCEGNSTDILASQNTNIASYLWNDGSSKNFILARSAGKYFVTATFNSGMSAIDSIELIVDKIFPASISGDTTTTIGSNNKYDFSPKVSGLQYSWNIRTTDFGTLSQNTDNSASIQWKTKVGYAALYLNSYKNQCVRIDSILIHIKAKAADTLSINGTVKAGTSFDTDGTVSLYTENDSITPVQTVIVSPNGAFAFNNVILGNYKLLATPNADLSNSYAATYYAKTKYFTKAASITIDGLVTGIDISLVAGSYTSINEITNTWQVYPNPASNYITINNNNEIIERITIYSLDGKMVLQSNDKTISISQLTSGLYKLIIISKTSTSTFMFVKE